MALYRIVVSSPDLIRRIYRFQYSPCAILKAIRAGVGFGSETETNQIVLMLVICSIPWNNVFPNCKQAEELSKAELDCFTQ